MVRILYTNHRGEMAWREIEPRALSFGGEEWYPQRCWLLNAYDLDKKAMRSFSLARIHRWEEVR